MPINYQYQGKELELFSIAKQWKKYFSQQLTPHIKGSVLEVGAGLGTTTLYLFNNKVSNWTMLEPDPEMFRQLSKKINDGVFPKSFKALHGTLSDTLSTYDTILFIDVLEHIKDDSAELEKAFHRISSTGSIIILAPAYQQLYNNFDRQIGHYRRYSKRRLRDLINPRYQIVSIKYIDSMGYFAALFNRLFLRQNYPTRSQIQFWNKFLIPLSKIFDRIFNFSFGKTIIVICKKSN